MARTPVAPDPNAVFINCPFDSGYSPMFEVMVFTVYACGFQPHTALEESDSGDVRLDKIARMIRQSRYGIHDISRVELDATSGLPRFNMPFELGLDLGCKKFGGPAFEQKRLLVLDSRPYRYQISLSDIAGQDIRSHEDNLDSLLTIVRNWLKSVSRRTTIPGDGTIRSWFGAFSSGLPDICADRGLDRTHLSYPDYSEIVEAWLAAVKRPRRTASR